MESNVDKAYVGGQLQKIYNLHVLIEALEPVQDYQVTSGSCAEGSPFPSNVVLEDHVGVVHLPLLALQENVVQVMG